MKGSSFQYCDTARRQLWLIPPSTTRPVDAAAVVPCAPCDQRRRSKVEDIIHSKRAATIQQSVDHVQRDHSHEDQDYHRCNSKPRDEDHLHGRMNISMLHHAMPEYESYDTYYDDDQDNQDILQTPSFIVNILNTSNVPHVVGNSLFHI